MRSAWRETPPLAGAELSDTAVVGAPLPLLPPPLPVAAWRRACRRRRSSVELAGAGECSGDTSSGWLSSLDRSAAELRRAASTVGGGGREGATGTSAGFRLAGGGMGGSRAEVEVEVEVEVGVGIIEAVLAAKLVVGGGGRVGRCGELAKTNEGAEVAEGADAAAAVALAAVVALAVGGYLAGAGIGMEARVEGGAAAAVASAALPVGGAGRPGDGAGPSSPREADRGGIGGSMALTGGGMAGAEERGLAWDGCCCCCCCCSCGVGSAVAPALPSAVLRFVFFFFLAALLRC